MSININRIRTQIAEFPLHQDRCIVTSLGRHDTSRYLLVSIEDNNGITGYGEAATVLMWSGEAAEPAQWIAENIIAPLILEQEFAHPKDALNLLDKAIVGQPFLKAAFDIALWDLWAKTQNSSVSELIADREPVAAVPSRFSIGAYSTEDTLRLATEAWESGIRTLKFKTGVPPFDDVERLRTVREHLGDEPVFTIDANGAYKTEEAAVVAIEQLLPFNLSAVEQPTPRDRIGMMAGVRKRVPVPILADESIFTPGELAEAIDCEAFDILSVYPGKNGGFTRSLEMIQTAQAAGKACVIGSNMETDIGQAAMVCLAASLTAFPVDQYASDLMTGMLYKASSTSPALQLEQGSLQLPTGIGFGVTPLEIQE